MTEKRELRKILVKVTKALGNGSCCDEDASLEFLSYVPDEVAIYTQKLKDKIATLEKEIEQLKFANAKVGEDWAEK